MSRFLGCETLFRVIATRRSTSTHLRRTYATEPSRAPTPLAAQGFQSWAPACISALADAKRQRHMKKLDEFHDVAKRGPVPYSRARSVLDRLSLIYPGGDEHLAAFSIFVHSFKKQSDMHAVPPPALSAVCRARTALRHTLVPRGDLLDMGIYVDASPWGIGMIVGREWDAWTLKHAQGRLGFDNNVGELLAVEVVVRLLVARGLHDSRVLIRTDSQTVRNAFLRGHGWHPLAEASLRRIAEVAVPRGLWPELERVPSKENLADPASRGKPPPGCSRIQKILSLPRKLSRYLERT